MKIATTTCDFAYWCKTDEERILELHKAGFKYIDLDMNFKPDSPYMQDNWRETAKKVKDFANSLGMKFVQAHSQGGNALSNDKEHVEFLIKGTIRSIELCEFLGIKNTVVHLGAKEGITKEEFFALNKEFYQNFFPIMEKTGVNVLCENSTKYNMPNMHYLYTGQDMLDFIKYVNHPQVHACWDTGHANCEGPQYNEIITLGNELYAIHYHDNRGKWDDHLVPYMGRMSNDEVLTALIDVGFKGYFTLETCISLFKYSYWDKKRINGLVGEEKVYKPQLFMQRHLEKLSFETAVWMLKTYGIFEE